MARFRHSCAPPPRVVDAGAALDRGHLERRAPVVADVRRHEVVRVGRVEDHPRGDAAARAERSRRQRGAQRVRAGGQGGRYGYPSHRRRALGIGSLMCCREALRFFIPRELLSYLFTARAVRRSTPNTDSKHCVARLSVCTSASTALRLPRASATRQHKQDAFRAARGSFRFLRAITLQKGGLGPY